MDIAAIVKGLTEAQRDILLHSLGFKLGYSTKIYRNHFVTGEGSIDYPDCMALVELGLMTKHSGSLLTGGDDLFFVIDPVKEYFSNG